MLEGRQNHLSLLSIETQNYKIVMYEEANKENAAQNVRNCKGTSDTQFIKMLCTLLDSVTLEVFVSC